MDRKREKYQKQAYREQLVGWILFLLCAGFFIASSLKNRDTLTFIGSVLFFISCIFFIIPLIREMKNSADMEKESLDKEQF